jgi:hypothetical protein
MIEKGKIIFTEYGKIPIKIVILGPYHAGKSTVVKSLCEDSVTTNRLGTTVSLDFGVKIFGFIEVNIFGSPGHDRFEFMRTILSQGAKALLLVVDSTFPETFESAMNTIKKYGYPFLPAVVLSNKQDLPGALPPYKVKEELMQYGLQETTPVVGTVATKNQGTKEALELVIRLYFEKLRGKKYESIAQIINDKFSLFKLK